MFKGSIVALVTPFKENKLDDLCFVNLIKWHNASKTSAIVVCGSTGEGALLTEKEREKIITLSIENSKIPIIVACGSPSTAEVISQAKQAEILGANALLVVAPPYAKTTQNGLFEHFKAIHSSTNLPIILYNNPARTVIEISVETALRLFELERIIGIKDSTADTSRAAQMRIFSKKEVCLLSGDDAFLAGYLAQGGDGVISVTANIKPKEMSELLKAWEDKNFELFKELNEELMKIHCLLANFEPNPIPIKAAMQIINKCSSEVRLPLVKASKETFNKLESIL